MPMLIMARDYVADEPTELDVCTTCGHQTTLIVWFQLHDELVGMCGLCIDELRRGYAELLRKRMRQEARK